MPETNYAADDRRRIVPLLLFAAIIIGVVPWLHPKNTCHEWLTKWGQLSLHPLWMPVHQFTMAGFLVLAAAWMLFPLLGKRSTPAVIGGATLSVGSLLMGGIVLIHASAAATLGRTFIAAKSPELKDAVRAAAEAFMSYDENSNSVAAALISFGCLMIVLTLVQERIVSRLAGLFLAGLGGVWAAHRYHVFNKLGFSIPETAHWDSLALWMAAIAIILHVHGTTETARNEKRAAAEPENSRHAMIEAVPEA
jgi:hypothetical protein